jgi:magnesium-transporting ATPase (P-type)
VSKRHNHDEQDGEKTLLPANQIFSTTTVTNGTTMAVVIAPGMTARIDRIAAQLTDGGKDKNSLGVTQQSVLPFSESSMTSAYLFRFL